MRFQATHDRLTIITGTQQGMKFCVKFREGYLPGFALTTWWDATAEKNFWWCSICAIPIAWARAENFRNSICARPILAAGKRLAVTMSVGVVLSNEFEGCGVEELIQQSGYGALCSEGSGTAPE